MKHARRGQWAGCSGYSMGRMGMVEFGLFPDPKPCGIDRILGEMLTCLMITVAYVNVERLVNW